MDRVSGAVVLQHKRAGPFRITGIILDNHSLSYAAQYIMSKDTIGRQFVVAMI